VFRSQLEQLLHENYLASGGDENVKCFFREQGFQTGISNVIKVGNATTELHTRSNQT
jgi:hypothetical protein